jgi:3-hydroxybutyryl-CoA dehydrogenase
MNKPGGTQGKRRVFIAGESPLVEEYGSACAAAGMEVAVRFNAGSGGSLPPGAVRRARVGTKDTVGIELTNTSRETKRKNLAEMDRALPPDTPILSASAATTVAEQSAWLRTPERLIGIAALPSLLHGALVEIAPSLRAGRQSIEASQRFFRELGKETSVVRDSPGMVLPRILCMLVNEASFALGEQIARRGDIDTAMTLGTNYPLGPFAWGMRIGFEQVRAVLEGLRREFGEERYRTAPLLLRGTPDDMAARSAGARPLHSQKQRGNQP